MLSAPRAISRRAKLLLAVLAAATCNLVPVGSVAQASLVAAGRGGGLSTAGRGASGAARPLTTVTLALDWTPNTDHTGFYVAEALGYYQKVGIRLKIIPYTVTLPDELVSAGRADFGISFESEVAIDKAQGLPVISVMAILQHMASVVGYRPGSGINRPLDLVGKTFAWDGGTDEIASIEFLIDKDGGEGKLPDGKPNFKVIDLNTSAYQAVYTGNADFDFPLLTWEVIQARLVGEPMGYFDLQHWGFPDRYEVVLISSTAFLKKGPGLARRFVQASAEGFTYAAHHPDQAARILIDDNPGVFSLPNLVYQSAELMAKSFWLGSSGRFGYQDYAKWYGYTRFAVEAGILHDASGKLVTKIPNDIGTWFTNAYLAPGR
ncbi:MAG TPA: ABC transporter substrate-binding protein [Acidimicrobiales bacterium]|nr:ABC transporter substrate-binding protein [Acidimicrobiales bacterium]